MRPVLLVLWKMLDSVSSGHGLELSKESNGRRNKS